MEHTLNTHILLGGAWYSPEFSPFSPLCCLPYSPYLTYIGFGFRSVLYCHGEA